MREVRKIAVDAMGGDFGAEAIVAGAALAVRANPGQYEVYLTGDEGIIRAELKRLGAHNLPLFPVHAPQVIGMGESPVEAIRRKSDSSMAGAVRLVGEGICQGAVSAGNTGAFIASAMLQLGRLPGVRKATIGTFTPGKNGIGFLLDIGANPQCKPHHLLQFGIMGSLFMKVMRRIENPSIGLLNIGEEEGKGNELAIEAHHLFRESGLNFYGNVEGRDILNGAVDVVVCDGFVGNIILKHSEAMLEVFKRKVREKMRYNPLGWIGSLLLAPVLGKIRKEFDYEEYGGVPLLGANGVIIVCHGSSSPRAIMRAITVADMMITENVNKQIEEQIAVKDATKTN